MKITYVCILRTFYRVQVPQYILDYYAASSRFCKIAVTQPRRIAAISIARRVCAERGLCVILSSPLLYPLSGSWHAVRSHYLCVSSLNYYKISSKLSL